MYCPRPTFDANWFPFAAITVFYKMQNWEPGTNKRGRVNGMASAQTMPNPKALIRQLLRSEVGSSVV
jgi:hypothetical protein